MDDPTKGLIPRSSIEYYLRKETVSTNPEEYEAHEKFIAYLDDPEISQFGRWMCSNGINTALVAIEVDLDKIPSAQPEQRWIPVSERLPEDVRKCYWVCTDTGYQCECRWTNINHIWTELTTDWHWHIMDIPQYSHVVAWMPLPEPYREEGGQE